MAQQVLQQPQRIEMGYQNPQNEEIPLNRLNSTEERDNRAHMREIFSRVSWIWFRLLDFPLLFTLLSQYDTDQDGFLNVNEMKILIRHHQCDQIPKEVARQILAMHDEDENNRLDFEEFYRLTQRHDWIFRGLLVKYCKMIVPSPHRPEQDEVGKKFCYFVYIFLVCVLKRKLDIHACDEHWVNTDLPQWFGWINMRYRTDINH